MKNKNEYKEMAKDEAIEIMEGLEQDAITRAWESYAVSTLEDAEDLRKELQKQYDNIVDYPSADDAGSEENIPLCYANQLYKEAVMDEVEKIYQKITKKQ